MPRTRDEFNENSPSYQHLFNQQLLEVLDDFFRDVQGGSRGRGGGIAYIDDAVIFLNEEVVHQSTFFCHRLGTDPSRGRGEMLRLDRWHQFL